MIPFGVTRSWSWSTVVTNKIYLGHEGATLLIGSASGNELKNVELKPIKQNTILGRSNENKSIKSQTKETKIQCFTEVSTWEQYFKSS